MITLISSLAALESCKTYHNYNYSTLNSQLKEKLLLLSALLSSGLLSRELFLLPSSLYNSGCCLRSIFTSSHLEDKSRVGLNLYLLRVNRKPAPADVEHPCAACRHRGECLCPTLDNLVGAECRSVRVALGAAIEDVAVDGLTLVAYGYVVVLQIATSPVAGCEHLVLQARR